jgi:murein DD-endopeptidase MepM/ murein hydrolase activator NlpD
VKNTIEIRRFLPKRFFCGKVGDRLKFIWGKKAFTLMIIPGANRRTVRIKLPHSSLYIVPGLMLLILGGFCFTIYWQNVQSIQTKNSLQQAYSGQEQKLTSQIADQSKELVELQANLIEMSQQTEAFQAKLEEIKQLRNVAELMTSSESAQKEKSKHVGGTTSPVTPEDAAVLATGTKQGLTLLVHDMNDILTSLKESEKQIVEAQHLKSITPTLWPIASHSITSGFGVRSDPFTQKPSMHTGLDIDGELNDPVYATAEGTVILSAWDNDHGNHILIDHTQGIKTEYLHLNKMLVTRGAKVVKGQLIGLVGSTGRSTGTHLHYEVQVNDVPVNPRPYLLSDRKDEP